MLRRVVVLLLGAVFLSTGCRTQSQWNPTVDSYGSSREQYLERDLEERREKIQESYKRRDQDREKQLKRRRQDVKQSYRQDLQDLGHDVAAAQLVCNKLAILLAQLAGILNNSDF